MRRFKPKKHSSWRKLSKKYLMYLKSHPYLPQKPRGCDRIYKYGWRFGRMVFTAKPKTTIDKTGLDLSVAYSLASSYKSFSTIAKYEF